MSLHFVLLVGTVLCVYADTSSEKPTSTSSLAISCVQLLESKYLRQATLFDDDVKKEGDCCLLQTTSQCFKSLCTEVTAPSDNGTNSSAKCDFLGQQAHLYQDHLQSCYQAYGPDLCVVRLGRLLGRHNNNTPPRSQSTEQSRDSHDSGSGMPLWLIILLVVLILIACGMIFFVVYLFRRDKEKAKGKKKKSSHSKRSSKK